MAVNSAINRTEKPTATLPRMITVIEPPALRLQDLLNNILKLVRYRDLIYTLSVHRIKVRYKQSVLGVSWALVQPVALMLIYTLIFSFIARIKTDGVPYALFAYTALLPWLFFSTAVTNATNGLVSHAQLITKVYFPREILPLTYVCAAFFDFLIASSVFIGLMIYYRVQISWAMLYVIPIVVLMVMFTTAVSLFFSATQVRFRDIGVAMPLLLQLWMFATPVVYPLSAVPARIRNIYDLNPMVGFIEGFRQVMLSRQPPNPNLLAVAGLVSLVLLVFSYIYFKRVEANVADVI